jgi:hypothetical protein
MSIAEEAAFRCPTCRAAQELTDTCRRCKCDLRLARETLRLYQEARGRCLVALRSGKPAEALVYACDCERLLPAADAWRLAAVCALCAGDWPAALAAARRAAQHS